MTIAASDGYPDPYGEHPTRYTTLDLGPDRVRFAQTVTVGDIHRQVGSLNAYAAGKRQATFHEIETSRLKSLLKLCASMNPFQKEQIRRIASISSSIHVEERTAAEDVLSTNHVLLDPVRREMIVEAFERKASWARQARQVYGYRCMAPRCSFELLKEDGDLYIEVHHLIPIYQGGSPNDLRNMSILCPNHHRLAHFGTNEDRSKLSKLVRREQAKRLHRAKLLP